MRSLMFLLLLISLAGCGFHLRGAKGFELDMDSVSLSAFNTRSEFSRTLGKLLIAQGVSIDKGVNAQYVIQILSDQISRRPVASASNSGVAEYELRLEINFQVSAQADEILIEPKMLAAERIYSFDSANLEGNSAEEELLAREMRQDIAEQVIRLLSATTRGRVDASSAAEG